MENYYEIDVLNCGVCNNESGKFKVIIYYLVFRGDVTEGDWIKGSGYVDKYCNMISGKEVIVPLDISLCDKHEDIVPDYCCFLKGAYINCANCNKVVYVSNQYDENVRKITNNIYIFQRKFS